MRRERTRSFPSMIPNGAETPTVTAIRCGRSPASGCGVVSFVNAIYALNGEYIDPTVLARYSNSHGHYFYMQGTADTLYADFARTNGVFYHFKWDGKIYDTASLKKTSAKMAVRLWLWCPVIILRSPGIGRADNSFLVLDSAIYNKRPTTIQRRLDQRSDPPDRNAVLFLFPSLQPRKIMAKTACILQKVMIKY